MQTVKRAVRKIIPRPVQTPPNPVEAEDSAYSAICSVYDEQGWASPRLVELGINAVERAMKDVHVRGAVWPGEEICLIGGLVLAMRPKLVVEIGESNQKASEVVKKYLEGGRFENVERVVEEIAGAELILVSGAADADWQGRVMEELGWVKFERPPIVVFNDTRRWEMLKFVRGIRWPKLDMTSFGRWSGTMLVEMR
jgi:hypothetical protein